MAPLNLATPRQSGSGGGIGLRRLLSPFPACIFLLALLQAALAAAQDAITGVDAAPGLRTTSSCPDVRITTRFFPRKPKAGGHVTVIVKLWALSASAVPASLVAHVPNGVDLIGTPPAPKGGAGGIGFYLVYDAVDDENMLVWEGIPLSRGGHAAAKPYMFRFKLKVEDCPPSGTFEFDFLTQLVDGDCLELKTTVTLDVRPKKHSSCTGEWSTATKGQGQDGLLSVAATCSGCSGDTAQDEVYALILSPGVQSKWENVNWGAYHITVSGYNFTLAQKKVLKTALQTTPAVEPGIRFNNCKVWHPSLNHAEPYPSPNANPVPNFVNHPINETNKYYDGLLMDSGVLCSLKQRLVHWAAKQSLSAQAFNSKGPAVNITHGCDPQQGTCECYYKVHTRIFSPFPYHITLALQGATRNATSTYSWYNIVKPDFLNLSTRFNWSLWLNRKPSCQCQKCGMCSVEKSQQGGYWDRIVQ